MTEAPSIGSLFSAATTIPVTATCFCAQVSPTERTRSNRLSKLFLISELVNLEVNIYNEEALLEEIQEKRFLQTLCMGMLYTNKYTTSYFAYGYASSC